ncbi:hypothetical protein DL771_005314 [Monosporascus sp. 5C6A]|nr:hypothetical protein DL771_005314 [Monosporascus sp. 5C6A]
MKQRTERSTTGGDLESNTTETYPHGVSEACRASQGCFETSTDGSDEARTRSDIEASDYIDDVTYEDLTEDEDDTIGDAVATSRKSSAPYFANSRSENKHGETEQQYYSPPGLHDQVFFPSLRTWDIETTKPEIKTGCNNCK